MADMNLDCKGLNCPMPIVRISRAIKTIEPGQLIEVEADDPAFTADVRAWVKRLGHELVRIDEVSPYRAVIRKV